MVLARDSQPTRVETRFVPPTPVPATELFGAIATDDGRYVTGGVVDIEQSDAGTWTATLRRLDRPGVVASMYFGDRLREVELRLEDGRRARARITGTTFIAGNERVCELSGLEELT